MMAGNTQMAAATPGTPSSIVSLDPLAQPTAGAMTSGPEGVWNVVADSYWTVEHMEAAR